MRSILFGTSDLTIIWAEQIKKMIFDVNHVLEAIHQRYKLLQAFFLGIITSFVNQFFLSFFFSTPDFLTKVYLCLTTDPLFMWEFIQKCQETDNWKSLWPERLIATNDNKLEPKLFLRTSFRSFW